MSADPRDAAQEFAERVAQIWFPGEDGYTYAEEKDQLVRIIANELRAGGWVKGGTGPHVPNPVDMADFDIS